MPNIGGRKAVRKIENKNSKSNKITIRISDSTLKKCEEGMAAAGTAVRNDFIEQAIEFYSGYVSSQSHKEFLSEVIVEAVRATVALSENRISRLLFKIAVELAKLERLLAVINEMDEESMRRLHIKCVNEVKKINGILKMEEAVRNRRNDDE